MFDYRTAGLSAEDRSLCEYAVKLTLTPGKVGQADVDRLHEAGFADDQISIAAQVTGYFNYINRIADGLGVTPESWMPKDPALWHQRKASDYTVDLS